jgi:hypothetical protein
MMHQEYLPLLKAISSAGADLTEECQSFLERKMLEFTGTVEEFTEFVHKHAHVWFRSSAAPPEWIQNAEWQFEDEEPMTFVGQVSICASAGLFHDEAAIFVFASASGTVKTVLQVS